jgi:hypothetical protein
MRVGSGNDNGKRDTFLINQNTSLDPVFSPDPLDFFPPLLAPAELCSWLHPRSATPSKYPEAHHIPANLSSRDFQRILPVAIAENICGQRFQIRTFLSEALSIVFHLQKFFA